MTHANATRTQSIRRRRLVKVPIDVRCPCSECRALDAAHPGEGFQLALTISQPQKGVRS